MKEVFKEFLSVYFADRNPDLLLKFESYHQALTSINQKINLISRKTPEQEYWTLHYLDSILPGNLLELNSSKVLDFGTGGGLPGIPLKLVFPDVRMYFLDSRLKKIEALRKIIKKLDLKDCFTIVSRLEELDTEWQGFFDFIVSRSVRITERFYRKMLNLLRIGGKIILYKGSELDDLYILNDYQIIDVAHPLIGKRNIIIIQKQGKNE